MGSGNLFKMIISLKRGKEGSPKNPKDSSESAKLNSIKLKNSLSVDAGALGIPVEDLAATKIQRALRAYKARKTLRCLKGIMWAKALSEKCSVKKQASTTFSRIHSWSRIQSQIRTRRICMVTEGLLKQKKFENQQKLKAKLHDQEVEWCGGSETREEIVARKHQRKEASVKRERAMAYAFSHQWRVDSQHQWLVNYGIGKTNWGWSWKNRWIAARPWEVRYPTRPGGATKLQNDMQVAKKEKTMNSPVNRTPILMKASLSNGKNVMKARRSSFPGADKPSAR